MRTGSVSTSKLYTDGASLGNPGPAGAGFVLLDKAGRTIAEQSIPLGEATNNVAEYRALIAGLHEALNRGLPHLLVVTDSELMCRQLQGRYRVRNAGLQPLYAWAKRLADRFEHFEISHCPREHNCRADELASEAARRSADQLRRAAGSAPARRSPHVT